MKKLIIVESPNKISSLEKYLGSNYIVKASSGHIFVLPHSGLHGFGVDIDTWTPNYKFGVNLSDVVKDNKRKISKIIRVILSVNYDNYIVRNSFGNILLLPSSKITNIDLKPLILNCKIDIDLKQEIKFIKFIKTIKFIKETKDLLKKIDKTYIKINFNQKIEKINKNKVIKIITSIFGNKYFVKNSIDDVFEIFIFPSSISKNAKIDFKKIKSNYKININLNDDIFIDNKDKNKIIKIIKLIKFIKESKQALKEVDDVYIATDPDREGEAIGDNIVNFLNIKNNYKRIRFNEINKDAILKAIDHPIKLDENLVNSQIARRILDRIIGFKLSKIMQLKIKNSPKIASAGRVQSIALKLVSEREKLIENFVPTKYKIVNALVDLPIEKNVKILLYCQDNKFNDKTRIPLEEFEKIESKFSKKLTVKDIKITNKKEKQIIPLKQSTLYKKGNSKLGMSAKIIQNVVQKLYEGYGEGGLISYPRTDSTRFSNTFLNLAKTYILKNYGKKYLLEKIKGEAGDQDAHEAIRPTSLSLLPLKAKKKFNLNSSEFNVYKLIWNHTMQSLMKAPIKENTRYEFLDNKLTFRLSYSKVIFDGYYKVIGYDENKQTFKFKKNQELKVKKYTIEDKETIPPSRYNDGSLIEKLDEIKVGRPSTFPTIVSILKQRFYVEIKNKAMKITNFGQIIYDKLINGFPKFMDEKYTAKLEEELNEIAKGKKDYKKMLSLFWKDFEKLVDEQLRNTQVTIIPLEKSEKKCPKCGSNLVIRTNKKSGNTFLGCPKFPKCKHAEPDPNFVPKFKSKFFKKTNKK